jgi:phosphoglycerate dehydrogenase-like enzyme
VAEIFRVGVTADFLRPDGSIGFGDIGLELLAENPRVSYEFLPPCGGELPRDVVDAYDSLLVLGPRVTAATVDGCRRLVHIARFGVGYDSVDVEACTRNDVLLSITPDGVRRPMALSALAMLLALTHRLIDKDRLTRNGRWGDKIDYMGTGLTGRTLGLVGLGNIGREILKLTAPLEMRNLAYDPYLPADKAPAGPELVTLERLAAESDFVCVCCALTPETHHLLDARFLARMRSTAFLVNVARGPIVDERALIATLAERRIAGAALDVFEIEPIEPGNRLLELDNVILAPHAIGWTDELFRGIGRSACRGVLDVAAGKPPKDVVNRGALERQGVVSKFERHGRNQEKG